MDEVIHAVRSIPIGVVLILLAISSLWGYVLYDAARRYQDDTAADDLASARRWSRSMDALSRRN